MVRGNCFARSHMLTVAGTTGKASSPPPALTDSKQANDKLETVLFQLRQVTRERDELRKRLALSSPGTTFDDCRYGTRSSTQFVCILSAAREWDQQPKLKPVPLWLIDLNWFLFVLGFWVFIKKWFLVSRCNYWRVRRLTWNRFLLMPLWFPWQRSMTY